ncbi:glycosyltransferase [Perlabentimonas gracilis]|uniref:glycosyltransferase n=1 Tax=Perlabentimonas gracilis TaxID=2715279 RepID=UPI00140C1CD9|nr:glycosyltransferase [Perlabentimonas gracilis]NHB67519.1 glycosyltransferase family 2 protein [Perlabentimonas gracilis]
MQHPYFKRHKSFSPTLTSNPSPNLGIAIVLPSFNEPNLWQSLQALANCNAPTCDVEVLVVVNYPEESSPEVINNALSCIQEVHRANELSKYGGLKFYPIDASNLPKKHAGVGLARKTGMDEAAWRLLQSDCATRVIACFDADATCTTNYLVELEKLWLRYPATAACSIRYEHPIEGNDFQSEIYQGIAEYELHLRYYVQAGKYIGHPFSEQTVGSSMACSADAYLRFGGMNKNKAGEDFYFLQKIIPHGNFRNLNTAVVYPSPRTSYRVPFGTGRAMTKYIENNSTGYLTYSIRAFQELKSFIDLAPTSLFNSTDDYTYNFMKGQPEPLRLFLEQNSFAQAIQEINNNTSSSENFAKRFFLWFDAFKLLKYLNFAHEKHYQRQPVVNAAKTLLELLGKKTDSGLPDAKQTLCTYRLLDAERI